MPRRGRSLAERRAERAEVDDPAVVMTAALRFLEARPRSIREVRRRLVGAGYREPLVDATLARLEDLGILDDAAFARAWIESRDRARPRGERALRSELLAKGVDREVVAVVLEARDAAADDGDAGVGADEPAAVALLERRRRTLDRVTDPRERRRRAYALLARAGFDPELAARLAEPFGRAEPDGPDPADRPAASRRSRIPR